MFRLNVLRGNRYRLWSRAGLNALVQCVPVVVLLCIPSLAEAVTIDTMLERLREQMGPLTQLVSAFAYLSGFYMMFRAFYHLKQYGEMRTMMASQTDLRGPISSIIVAMSLIFLPTIITTSFVTVYGTDTVTAYQDGGTGWDDMAKTLVVIVQFIGGIAFIRGLFHFHRLGSGQAQQGTFGKAVTHVVGGVLALNIVGAKDILYNTLGIF